MPRSQKSPIDSLQHRFIWMSTIAATVLIALVLVTLNVVAYARIFTNEVAIAQMISENGGVLPDDATIAFEDPSPYEDALGAFFGSHEFARDRTGLVRYFCATVDADGTPLSADVSHITGIDEEHALALARTIYGEWGSFSFDDSDYFYASAPTGGSGEKTLTALDATYELHEQRVTTAYSIVIGIAFDLLFLIMVMLLSHRAVQPFERNMRSQRQFITNASHELKTPLAIMQANTDLQEMVGGATEQTGEIKHQVKRLNELVERLLLLSRLQETDAMELEATDISEIVQSIAGEWRVPVEQGGKTFEASVAPGLKAKVDARMFHELVNILVDNANKYCDAEGAVSVRMSGKGSKAVLVVSNSYAAGKEQDFSRFFERFYREDESHSSQRKGAGIGLSVASQIVEDFGGTIRVSWSGGTIFFTVVL
ncbi:sensor histidine kinase [Curtanaerobium respiraculi]|uniref:sensor histidine kinase n=1 Tax=Curtanaerobium respiraculi TaxID=2949669 RepID=UPI0024B3A7B1|nr:HAMP domain-containing sensor histidine kinase [Curtanaerobium respiraculi]